VDAFLVTFQPHLHYLSGFSGSSGIGLVTSRHSCLITDGRYRQQAKDEVVSWSVTISNKGLFEGLASTRLLRSGLRIGFDGNNVSLTQYRLLKKTFPAVRFIPRSETIEQLCARKDGREIDLIKRAVSISDEVFDGILTLIKPGVLESEIAAEITYRQRRLGADRDAFEPIVASGERSALPHGRATTRKLRSGDLLTLDFGCVVGGYHSDMTRTVGIGRLSTEARRIYSTVLDAQQLACDHVREGIECRELDRIARDRIASAGYGKFFQHSLGHGIGLQIHEAPRISVQSKGRLAPGNVITIEPGIYVPGTGGVRIEDDLVVTANGGDILNTSVKDLIIL
jgi:Xaa-Pro aminopeptidase